MSVRKLKMLLRDREIAILAALAVLTIVLCGALALRLGVLWRLYLVPSYRRDAVAVLGRLRDDTGWGLSNFEIRGTDCSKTVCGMGLDFAYHAPAKIKPPKAVFRLTWTPGKPESYAIHVN